MAKLDQEIKKTFEISLDDSQKVINIVFFEQMVILADLIRQTELVEVDLMQILNQNKEQKFNVLIDVLKLGRGGGDISLKPVRDIYVRMAQQKQINKIAVLIIGNPILEIMASMALRSIHKGKDIRFCTNKEEALTWLKKE